MSIRIRLKPYSNYYSIIVIDARRSLNSNQLIEHLGYYLPTTYSIKDWHVSNIKYIEISITRLLHWISIGGQCSKGLLRVIDTTGLLYYIT